MGHEPVDDILILVDLFGAHNEGAPAGLLRDISRGSKNPQSLSKAAPADGQLRAQLLLGRELLPDLQVIRDDIRFKLFHCLLNY